MLWPEQYPLVMLHSGRYHSRQARWTIMASPVGYLQHKHNKSQWITKLDYSCPVKHLSHNPLHDLQKSYSMQYEHITEKNNQNNQYSTTLKNRRGGIGDRGGWIGYLSYDLGKIIETTAQNQLSNTTQYKKLNNPESLYDWPLFELAYCPSLLIYDHAKKSWYQTSNNNNVFPDLQFTETIQNCINNKEVSISNACDYSYKLDELRPEQSRSAVESAIDRTIQYIKAGDIFQANITQAFNAGFSGSTRALFKNATMTSAPWYGGYLELDINRTIISLSPEMFLEVNPADNTVVTRPIKGTRPEQTSTTELENSEKDAAELNMIVDLMRNDLGRVCNFGSVKVVESRRIETHPTVQHGVATVIGTLKESTGLDDLLIATFPPGSITGAPKIRAMQIIDELEPHQRGPCFGSIGYIGCNRGYINLNVAIRTMLITNNKIRYMAGGGIVADSHPSEEYNESLLKTTVVQNLVTLSHLIPTQTG